MQEEEFEFSEFPARFGPFICGLILITGAYLSGHLGIAHRSPASGLAIAAITTVLVASIGRILVLRVLHVSYQRRSSVNLIATRGETPRVWLVAHVDSKSQTVPMLLRIASIVSGATLFALLAVLLGALAIGFVVTDSLVDAVTVATIAAFIPFTLCFIGNRSRGALDNASGVAAVLLAAKHLDSQFSAGILITSGEELALAGARAFTAKHAVKGIAINCDTIDREGSYVCMTSGRGRSAARALERSAHALGIPLKTRATIPGILTDSVALADAGWDTCTLSRGNLATLGRVHTSKDEPGRIDGTGIAFAAQILAATIEELA